MRLTVNDKRRDFGLGPLHKVTLHEARGIATEYRARAYRGIKSAAQIPTFKAAAEEVYAQRRALWNNGKHVDQWLNTLRDYAFPHIGTKRVSDIGTADILKVLSPVRTPTVWARNWTW